MASPQTFALVDMDALKSIVSDSVKAGIADYTKSIPAPKAKEEGTMTRQETADFFHISLQTLDAKTRSGVLTAHRFGGRVLYKRSECEAALVATNRYTTDGAKRGPKPKATA